MVDNIRTDTLRNFFVFYNNIKKFFQELNTIHYAFTNPKSKLALQTKNTNEFI